MPKPSGGRSLPAVVCAVTCCIFIPACGGSSVDTNDARDVATQLLAAYETADAEAVCALSSRDERKGLSSVANSSSSGMPECVRGAKEFFAAGDSIDRLAIGFVPGKITDVSREDETVVVTVSQRRTFTDKQRRDIVERYGADFMTKRPKELRIKVREEDGRLVARF